MLKSNVACPDMPPDFSTRIHEALKAWYAQQLESVFQNLLLTEAVAARAAIENAHLVQNQVLLDGLEHLRAIHSDQAELLQRRFLNDETARQVAYSRNVSDDVVYQQQRNAIEQLAQYIWAQEQQLRQQRAQRIETRFPPPTYTELFGVTDKLQSLRGLLETQAAPWLVSLEGMGGIGKTSLADRLARLLAQELRFRDIVWVSARQRFFQLPGSIEDETIPPSLTFEELLDRVIEQLDLKELLHQSDQDKLSGVKAVLKEQPYLIVVDNLETISDCRALVTRLRHLITPSKFLLTSRYSLRGEGGVYIVDLAGLTLPDTLALVRAEAQVQGFHELADASEAALAPIHAATGGNPLAIKLVIGQARTFPLKSILARLQQVQEQSAETLLAYIHEAAWHTLSPKCQQTMQALTLVTDSGGELEHIVAATGLAESEVVECLNKLTGYSLVNVRGDLECKSYSLHALTRSFVLQQFKP